MERQRFPAGGLLQRVALDFHFGDQPDLSSRPALHAQASPLNIYETKNDVVLVAPMPGDGRARHERHSGHSAAAVAPS